MNSSEYNSTRTEGEPIVGSGVGAAPAKPAHEPYSLDPSRDVFPDPDPHNEGSIEAVAARAARERAMTPKERAMALIASGAGIVTSDGPLDAEDAAVLEELKQEMESGEPQQPRPLAPAAAGYDLVMPSSAAQQLDWSPESVVAFGPAAKSMDLSPQLAQHVVDLVADATTAAKPGPHGYDMDATLSTLRREWGEALYPRLEKVHAFTSARPALEAYLNATGQGNNPAVVRLLAAAAEDTSILTKVGAVKYLASVAANPKHEYWTGDRHAVARYTLALAVSGSQA